MRGLSIGQQVNDLTALRDLGGCGNTRRYEFECSCGSIVVAHPSQVKRGHTKSCGHRRGEDHGCGGRERTPEYAAWCAMKQRASESGACPERYIDRGIIVCERWRSSFTAFLEDVGKRPFEGMTVERIDNDKGYEPGNVKWATPIEQSRNKSNNHRITVGGVTRILIDWAAHTGIDRHTILRRIRRGWSEADAASTPNTRVQRSQL